MTFNRILVSTVMLVSLIQFITCAVEYNTGNLPADQSTRRKTPKPPQEDLPTQPTPRKRKTTPSTLTPGPVPASSNNGVEKPQNKIYEYGMDASVSESYQASSSQDMTTFTDGLDELGKATGPRASVNKRIPSKATSSTSKIMTWSNDEQNEATDPIELESPSSMRKPYRKRTITGGVSLSSEPTDTKVKPGKVTPGIVNSKITYDYLTEVEPGNMDGDVSFDEDEVSMDEVGQSQTEVPLSVRIMASILKFLGAVLLALKDILQRPQEY